jgi:hypothetical protein
MKIEFSPDDAALFTRERNASRLEGKGHDTLKGEFGRTLRRQVRLALIETGVEMRGGSSSGAGRIRETPEIVMLIASMRRAGKTWSEITGTTGAPKGRAQTIYTQWLEDQLPVFSLR